MSQPKSVTISQEEYSALLGVVAAHRADSATTPSKVLAHYDAVTHRDPGGRDVLAEDWQIIE